MEARYLNDELEEVLNQPCFLDSQNLRNLNLMITEGLLHSDVIILIGTRNYFTRPYCLVEVWCAQRFQRPIVVCAVDGRGFDWGLASDQLSDLEATLGHEGAATVCDAIQAVLDVAGEHGEQAPSIDGIGQEILTALRVGERLEACATINQPSAPTRDASPERSGRGRAFSTEAIAYSEQRYRYSGTSPKPNGFALAPTIMRAADVDTLSREVGEQPWTKRLSPFALRAGLRASVQGVQAAITGVKMDGVELDGVGLQVESGCLLLQASLHPWGTDNELLADVADLIDLMCLALGRPAPKLQARRHDQKTKKAHVRLSRFFVRTARKSLSLPARKSVSNKKAAVQRQNTMTELSAPKTVATLTHKLCISCARDEAESVEAAMVLQSRLAERLDGGVHFASAELKPLAHAADSGRIVKMLHSNPLQSVKMLFKEPSKPSDESASLPRGGPGGIFSGPHIKAKHSAMMVEHITTCLSEGVGKARGLLLLQTAAVLTHPISLLEMYWAIRRGLPIVCLRLEGGSYDFGAVKPFLQDLENNLYAKSPIEASVVAAWLDEHMITFSHLAKTLADVIPSILTLNYPFHAEATENHVAATVEDIYERLMHELGPHETPTTTELLVGIAPTAAGVRRRLRSLIGVSNEEKAAQLVQAQYRMQVQRRAWLLLRHSCVLLQALTRGLSARKRTQQLRIERDALITVCLWLRKWVYRFRRQRLQQAEKKTRFDIVVRRHCHKPSTTASKAESKHWRKMRENTATLLCKLKDAQKQEIGQPLSPRFKDRKRPTLTLEAPMSVATDEAIACVEHVEGEGESGWLRQ